MALLWFILIGVAAGWLAGQIMKGSDFGLLGDLIVGDENYIIDIGLNVLQCGVAGEGCGESICDCVRALQAYDLAFAQRWKIVTGLPAGRIELQPDVVKTLLNASKCVLPSR